MRLGTNVVVALLASLGLLACGGARRDAQAPEANPWADYKGTYAPGGAQDEAPSETKPKSIAVAPAPPVEEEAPAKPTRGKPKKGAAAKPGKTTAASTESATAAPTPAAANPDDVKSMYGAEGSAPAAADDAAAAPAKKAPKKRAAGKKGGAKKAAPAKN